LQIGLQTTAGRGALEGRPHFSAASANPSPGRRLEVPGRKRLAIDHGKPIDEIIA